jgi:hypothetical protein
MEARCFSRADQDEFSAHQTKGPALQQHLLQVLKLIQDMFVLHTIQ